METASREAPFTIRGRNRLGEFSESQEAKARTAGSKAAIGVVRWAVRCRRIDNRSKAQVKVVFTWKRERERKGKEGPKRKEKGIFFIKKSKNSNLTQL